APDVAVRAVPADEYLFLLTHRDGTADFIRVTPDHLGVVADVAHLAGRAVVRKYARFEVALFRSPVVDHIFRTVMARRSAPDVAALHPRAIRHRSMLKLTGARLIACPLCGRTGQIVVPVRHGHTNLGTLNIMAGE